MEDSKHISALTQILEILQRLSPERRRQVLEAVVAFHSEASRVSSDPLALPVEVVPGKTAQVPFSERRDITVNEFLLQKQPKTGMEKAVCLAFYLKHYVGLPKFKPSDITRLNAEVSGGSVAELSRRIYDATSKRYLTKFSDGRREITSRGEIFVLSLPEKPNVPPDAIKRSLHAGRFKETRDVPVTQIDISARGRRS
jgi:hypothetical protein